MFRGEGVQGTVLFLLHLLTKKNLDLTFQYSFDGTIFEILLFFFFFEARAQVKHSLVLNLM